MILFSRVNTPPGSKILLSGTVEVETNFLLLNPKNTSLLGGRVESLADPWELKKLNQTVRSYISVLRTIPAISVV